MVDPPNEDTKHIQVPKHRIRRDYTNKTKQGNILSPMLGTMKTNTNSDSGERKLQKTDVFKVSFKAKRQQNIAGHQNQKQK